MSGQYSRFRALILASLVGVIAITSGCSASSTSHDANVTNEFILEVAPDWVEPEWMTSHRMLGTEFQTARAACYEAAGVMPIIEAGFGISARITSSPEVTDVRARMQEVSQALDECNELFPFPYFGGQIANPELYQRMLDTRECLIAHGQPVPEPISQESWIQRGGNWVPISVSSAMNRPAAEFRALERACPQSGPHWSSLDLYWDES